MRQLLFSDTDFWHALTYESGLGYAELHDLLRLWKTDGALDLRGLFEATPTDWAARGLTASQARGLRMAGRMLAGARRALEESRLAGLRMTHCMEPDYPSAFTHTLGALRPPVLFSAGNVELLKSPQVAIIGARQAKTESLQFAADCAARAARAGLVVVSGFAEGVDQAASMAALQAGGSTIIILPQGLLTVRSRGFALSEHMEEGRLLAVSACRPRDGWQASRALQRNGMITAMARDVIVAQSGKSGGSWEASRTALRQGRRVWLREDSSPELGHAELILQGAASVPWPSRKFPAWFKSLIERAKQDPASDPDTRIWTEAAAIELLRTAGPDEIHAATGLTGALLSRIIEGRKERPLNGFWDLTKFDGLGPASAREAARAFGIEPPDSESAQLPLFPEVEAFQSWREGEGKS
jgi:DNA processing protein